MITGNGFNTEMDYIRCIEDGVINITVYLARNFYLAVFCSEQGSMF